MPYTRVYPRATRAYIAPTVIPISICCRKLLLPVESSEASVSITVGPSPTAITTPTKTTLDEPFGQAAGTVTKPGSALPGGLSIAGAGPNVKACSRFLEDSRDNVRNGYTPSPASTADLSLEDPHIRRRVDCIDAPYRPAGVVTIGIESDMTGQSLVAGGGNRVAHIGASRRLAGVDDA